MFPSYALFPVIMLGTKERSQQELAKVLRTEVVDFPCRQMCKVVCVLRSQSEVDPLVGQLNDRNMRCKVLFVCLGLLAENRLFQGLPECTSQLAQRQLIVNFEHLEDSVVMWHLVRNLVFLLKDHSPGQVFTPSRVLQDLERVLGKPQVLVRVFLMCKLLIGLHELDHDLAREQAPILQEYIPGKKNIVHRRVQSHKSQHIVVQECRF